MPGFLFAYKFGYTAPNIFVRALIKMDNQQLFNVLFAIVGVLGGWWMKAMWEAVKDLEKADRVLSSQVGDLKVLVAGGYVRTESFDSLSKAIFAKLDRIEDKLDQKADK